MLTQLFTVFAVELGLRVWRVVGYRVVPWPKNRYGHFYDGDSYVLLNTFKVRAAGVSQHMGVGAAGVPHE
jgi:gelsolin